MSGLGSELGDLACVCSACGWARRYFPGVIDPPAQCPDCGLATVSRCPECDGAVHSIVAVVCDSCGTELRSAVVGSMRIRRAKRLPNV